MLPDKTQDSTNHDSTRTRFVGFRIDGVRDVAVDTAPHTNVMAIEIIPAGSDTMLARLSVEQLPKGISAVFSADSGRGSFKTSLHFSYDYTGAVGTYPAAITIRKGDSMKTVRFAIIVPDTPTNGYVFAGRKSAAGTAYHIRDSADRKNSLYLFPGSDSALRFDFNYRLWPLPTADARLPISDDFSHNYYNVGFTAYVKSPLDPWHSGFSSGYLNPEKRVQYYYNNGKPRVKIYGAIVQSDPRDTMTRRYLSFSIQMR